MNNEIIIIVYKLFYCKLFYYYLYIKNRKKFNLIFKINFIYNRDRTNRMGQGNTQTHLKPVLGLKKNLKLFLNLFI